MISTYQYYAMEGMLITTSLGNIFMMIYVIMYLKVRDKEKKKK